LKVAKAPQGAGLMQFLKTPVSKPREFRDFFGPIERQQALQSAGVCMVEEREQTSHHRK
jgi:hypothetical protein